MAKVGLSAPVLKAAIGQVSWLASVTGVGRSGIRCLLAKNKRELSSVSANLS